MGTVFWYSVISITTIGYGDLSASTVGARVGTIVFITALGLTAFTASAGMIMNYPNESRVRHIIEEFTSDPRHQKDDIAIVTDSVESLPFSHTNIYFVRGSPLETETDAGRFVLYLQIRN